MSDILLNVIPAPLVGVKEVLQQVDEKVDAVTEKVDKVVASEGDIPVLHLESNETNKEYKINAKPTQFIYGTPAPDGTGNIASGIVYRISTDDDSAPGSADYKAGHSLEATNKASFAAGCNNKSTANYAATFGSHNINSSYGGFVAGTYNIALGDYPLGTTDTEANETMSQYSTLLGRNGVAAAHLTFVEGDSTKNGFKEYGSEIEFRHITHSADASEYLFGENGFYAKWLAKGRNFAAALGDFSHVGGLNSVAGHAMTFAHGESAFAGGQGSTAFGKHTQAKGSRSFVIGTSNIAAGNNSFGTGFSTNSIGNQSFSGGTNSVATGEDSFAFGQEVKAEGVRSVAFGYQTNATNEGAVAFGCINEAIGKFSFTSGCMNHSAGDYSTTLGYSNVASGHYSVALCFDTSATGEASFAAGSRAFANGDYSAAIGYNVTSDATGQVVVGKFNNPVADSDDTSKNANFIVGAGTSSKLNNGFVVYSDGHAEVLTQGTTDKSVVIKKTLNGYATETFVNNAIANAQISGGDIDLSGYATTGYVDDKFTNLDAATVKFDGEGTYCGGENVDDALKNLNSQFGEWLSHVHDAVDIGYANSTAEVNTVQEALDYLIDNNSSSAITIEKLGNWTVEKHNGDIFRASARLDINELDEISRGNDLVRYNLSSSSNTVVPEDIKNFMFDAHMNVCWDEGTHSCVCCYAHPESIEFWIPGGLAEEGTPLENASIGGYISVIICAL